MPTRPERRRVTRDDVARQAGVSTAVVSYVLNNGPRPVSAATADRVRRAVSELGYQPNPLAAALRAGRSRFIGLVTPDTTNPFFAMLTRAVEDAALTAGYVVLVGNSEQRLDRERHYLQAFANLQVAGVLLVSCVKGAPGRNVTGALRQAGIPIVLLDRLPKRSAGTAVVVDNAAGARLATEHLIEHGCRTVAAISGPDSASTAIERLDGYRQALADCRPRIQPRALHGEFSRQFGYDAGLRLLRGPSRPDGVFVASDQQAIGLLSAAYELGVTIPDELAVTSFDDVPEAEFTAPPLTTVSQPINQLAGEAVGIVVARGMANRHTVRIPVTLHVRRSCGCASPKRPDPRRA